MTDRLLTNCKTCGAPAIIEPGSVPKYAPRTKIAEKLEDTEDLLRAVVNRANSDRKSLERYVDKLKQKMRVLEQNVKRCEDIIDVQDSIIEKLKANLRTCGGE